MRRIEICIAILVIIFALTGCQGISQLNSSQIILSPENSNIPLQGTWKFTQYKRISEVQEDYEIIKSSQKLMGKAALFSDKWAMVADEGCSDAVYQIRKVKTGDYFLFHYNIDVEELGIEKPMIDIVSITSNGALFFDVALIDEDTAMVYMDRCLYWLKKVSPEVEDGYEDVEREPDHQITDLKPPSKELRSGVFIGLRSTVPASDTDDGYGDRSVYRTIWISAHNSKVESILEAPDLFVPRRSGFWTLKVRTRKMDRFFEDYIELRPLETRGVNTKESYDERSQLKGNIKKDILFVGDDYLAIEYFESRGPEPFSQSSYRVLPLDDANSHKGILVSDIADEGMKDIFYRSAQSHLVLEGMRFNDSLRDEIREDNFTMVRRNGHWTLKGRLNFENTFEEFNIGLMPVGKLINYDELHVSWDTIKEKIPAALDAYTSPNKELLIVVTGNFIAIYSIEDGQISDKPMRKISIKKGESVIMAEWATGDYVARWEKSFNQLNPYVVNE